MRNALIIAGITFGLLIIIDVSFRVVFHFYDARSDYRVEADVYEDEEFALAYFEEYDKANEVRWEPYVYWRRKAFEGNWINIDEEGRRKTYTPGSIDKLDQKRMFVFGGSTLWGTGASDDQTIPSFVSKILEEEGMAYEVENWGETGYASTQNLIQLIRLLQKGEVPDVVIFYDGVNDAFNALQRGRAGDPTNEFNREAEFNLLNEHGRLYGVATKTFLKKGLYRFIQKLVSVMRILPEDRQKDLAVETASIYIENVKMVLSLSEMYGFKPLFFWQPIIFNKNHLSDYEKTELEKQQYGEQHYHRTTVALHALLQDSQDYPVFDLSEMFKDIKEPLFIDFCHLSGKGNKLIADELTALFIENSQDSTARMELNR